MYSAAPDHAFIQVSSTDAKVVVPPWYRPGYPESVRGAAWKRLRPKFQQFLERAYSRGEFTVYRPEPLWLAAQVAQAEGTPQIYQPAPEPLPSEGELVLHDPEPAAAVEQDLTLLEKLGDRPILFATLVALGTLGALRFFRR